MWELLINMYISTDFRHMWTSDYLLVKDLNIFRYYCHQYAKYQSFIDLTELNKITNQLN